MAIAVPGRKQIMKQQNLELTILHWSSYKYSVHTVITCHCCFTI